MQKRFEDAPIQRQDVEAFRAQLRALSRRIGRLDQHQGLRGEPLPPSYAQALVLLLGFEAREATPTLSELVELLDIDKSNVTRLCQKMERDAHITITRDARDRRAKRVALSAEGRALAEHINTESLDRVACLFGKLSDAERRNLVEALELLGECLVGDGEG